MIEKQEPNPKLLEVRKIRNDTANELLSIVLMFNTLEKVRSLGFTETWEK